MTGDPDGGDGLYYLHGDHLGSLTLMTDSDGALVADSVARFLPFGAYRSDGSRPVDGNDVSDRGFTGHYENREIGLTYIRAWYYAPELRRFISADTIVPDPGASIGYNRFAYANQNPISFLDPTGMFTEDAIMDYILNQECAGGYACATQMFYDWSQDDEWWAMLREAQAGDILYGAYGRYTLADGQFYFRFLGHERNSLTGIAQVNIDGSTAGAMFPGLAPVSLGLLKAGQTKTRMPGAAQEFTAFFSWGGLMSPFGDLLYDRVLHWSQIGDPSSGWKPGAASWAFVTTVTLEALKDAVCGNVPGCGPIIDGAINGYEAGKPTSFTAQTADVLVDTYGRTWTHRYVVLVTNYQSGGQIQDHELGWIVVHSGPNKVFR